jgi:hypothetical protein
VASKAWLDRLSMKGSLRVRIMWTMSVCENRDSMNQPVWNSAACAGVLAPSSQNSAAKVR